MSDARELLLSDLVGRVVRDAAGEKVGRIEELDVEIVQHAHGNDYVVTAYHLGTFGAAEAMAGSRFARALLQRLGRVATYTHYRVPWRAMDLSDPRHPRVTCRREELEAD